MAVHGGTVSDAALETVCPAVRVVVMAGEAGPAYAAVRVGQRRVGELTRHLLVDHGYRRLAFVGNPDGSPDVSERWEAFLAAHRGARPRRPPSRSGSGLQQSDGVIAARQAARRRGDAARRRWSAPTTRPPSGLMIGALGRGPARTR